MKTFLSSRALAEASALCVAIEHGPMRFALCLMLLLASSARASEWREYQSKHFLVRTDVSRLAAQVLLKRLETMHLLELKAMVGEEVEIPGRLQVIALGETGLFRSLLDSADTAGFFKYSKFGDPTIVFPVEGFTANPQVVAHEVAHYLSWYVYPRQPHWFSEGLAEFFQTVASETSRENVPERGGHIVRSAPGGYGAVGYASADTTAQVRLGTQVPVADLLKWDGVEDATRTARYHFWSWALYHYLWNVKSKQFTRYQQALGDGGDPDIAWRDAFPELSAAGAMEKLDSDLLGYCRSGRYSFYRVAGEGDATATEKPWPAAEAHLTLLELRSKWPTDPKALADAYASEVQAIAEEDPGNPVLLSLQEKEKQNLPATAASRRAAAAARPGDWRGWLLLAEALNAPADKAAKESALRKAIQLNPDNARVQNNLAWALVGDARAKEALPFANRAADLAPWDPGILDTLASTADALGKCPAALQLQRRAAAMDTSEAIHKTLAQYEARCGGPGGAAK